MDEIYSSVRSETLTQTKVEGSRFIAEVFPVDHEDAAKTQLDAVRKKFFDATHHCYAYVIGSDPQRIRSSDDGEPSGTAGAKILSAIQSKNLSDILVVVTRYFGGTKLGVGGLGRAYGEAAEAVLAKAPLLSKAAVIMLRVEFPFTETNAVMNIIHVHKLKIVETSYSESSTILQLPILPSSASVIADAMINATRGSAVIVKGEQRTMVWQ